jgi:chromosome segregation protein
MYLKRMEILGFKSFLKGIRVELEPGITGVVGPNGCGKSNITEAIRWVLGEQNARLLRGETMEDVIFNGTRSRKPLGMAEVSLTIANDQGRLPIDFSEVTITRRVFRSGVSEYLLNKSPVRLKDIRDLFTDTGMGNFSYSLIERAMVDTLINNTSANLRVLLEEAAGIVKYKTQERLALKKLEATEKDLFRIRDIVSEVEKRVRSLKRQESKARRYRSLKTRERELGIVVARNDREALRAEAGARRAAFESAQDAHERAAAELAQLEARLEETRASEDEGTRAVGVAQGAVEDVAQRLRDLARERDLIDEREMHARERIREADAAVADARARLVAAADERAAKSEELGAVRRGLDAAGLALDERKRRVQALDPELATLRADVKSRKQLALEIVRSDSERRGELGSLEGRLAGIAERLARLEAERGRLAAERERLGAERARVAAERAALEAEAARLEAAHGEAARAVDARQSAREEVVARLSVLEGRRESIEGNLGLLRDLEARYEGFRKGARTILLEAGGGRHRGVVGEVLRLRDESLRPAISAALGGTLEAFVVDDDRAGLGLLDFLRAEDRGRATFLLLDRFRSGGVIASDHAVLREPGVLGVGRHAVEADGPFSAILDFLLGRVVVVEDVAAALRLSSRPEFWDMRFVARSGEVSYHPGVVAGGSQADDRHGFFERKGEIVERERELARVLAELVEASSSRERLDGEVEAARARLAEADAALRDARARSSQRARDEESLGAALAERTARAAALDDEGRELAAARAAVAREAGALRADAARAGVAEEEAGSTLGALEARLHAAESEREEAARLLAETQVTHARLSTRLDALLSEIARAEALQAELTERIAAKQEEGRLLGERVAEMEGARARLGEREVVAVREREQREEARDRLINANQEIYDRRADLERRVKATRKTKEEARERVHALEVESGEIQARTASLETRALDEFGRTLDALIAELPADAGAARLDPGAAEDEEAEPGAVDGAAVAAAVADAALAGPLPAGPRADLLDVRRRLDRIGPVNLVALEEYEKENERYTFLKTQETDLIAARDSLNETIRTVDAKARTLFHETYVAVREHFKTTFTTLFEGGEADIILQDPSNPLETEIEIVARPGGKKLQRVALMSGGERALTAISILFALYLHKPSPFCILDEVDAPLDEANVMRFVSLLRAFSERTQFMVVTHNKRTMEATDSLFGVTMEEPGVSKLVSVKLSEIGDRFPLEAAATAG